MNNQPEQNIKIPQDRNCPFCMLGIQFRNPEEGILCAHHKKLHPDIVPSEKWLKEYMGHKSEMELIKDAQQKKEISAADRSAEEIIEWLLKFDNITQTEAEALRSLPKQYSCVAHGLCKDGFNCKYPGCMSPDLLEAEKHYYSLLSKMEEDTDAIEFGEWMNEVFQTYSNGATIRRCMSQKPDHKLYALFDKKEGLVGKGHQYFTLTELYKIFKHEQQ